MNGGNLPAFVDLIAYFYIVGFALSEPGEAQFYF